jgi:hypothetical protein
MGWVMQIRSGAVASQWMAHSKRFLQSAVDFIRVSSLFVLIKRRDGRSVWISDFLIATTGTQQVYQSGKVSRGGQQDWMQQTEDRSGSGGVVVQNLFNKNCNQI